MSHHYLWDLLDLTSKPYTETRAENSDQFYLHMFLLELRDLILPSGSKWTKSSKTGNIQSVAKGYEKHTF